MTPCSRVPIDDGGNDMFCMNRITLRLIATLVAPLVFAGCARAMDDVGNIAAPEPHRSKAALHLILSVPERVEAQSQLVDTATALQGARIFLETPWVRSLKRDAPSGFQKLSSLGFADEASLQAWRTAHATQLAAPLTLKRARVLTKSDAVASGSDLAMFKISYYSLVAPLPEFEKWVDGYLAKYLSAQRAAGILSSYVMYLEEEDHGRALLVLEYPDAATEQSAEPIKEKLSEQLAARDAEYAKLMPLKEELRTTQSWTLAVPLALE
jgi:hypothetical protein